MERHWRQPFFNRFARERRNSGLTAVGWLGQGGLRNETGYSREASKPPDPTASRGGVLALHLNLASSVCPLSPCVDVALPCPNGRAANRDTAQDM